MSSKLEILALALFLDFVLREPPGTKLHPIVCIGSFVERSWRCLKLGGPSSQRILGVSYVLGILSAATGGLHILLNCLAGSFLGLLASALALKYSFSFSAFFDSAKPVVEELRRGSLEKARVAAKAWVTRDTSRLDQRRVCSAVVESVAENLPDGLLTPLIAFLLFGTEAAFAARLVNLLDGLLGQRGGEKEHFGWFAAKLDDAVQFFPARVSALLIVALSPLLRGNASFALRVLLENHSKVDGINPGYPIAAMAGALRVELEKPSCYRVGRAVEELSPEKIEQALAFIPLSLVVLFISCSPWLLAPS